MKIVKISDLKVDDVFIFLRGHKFEGQRGIIIQNMNNVIIAKFENDTTFTYAKPFDFEVRYLGKGRIVTRIELT